MANLYCWSGATGTGSGADWTNAKTTISAALTTEVAGDTIFVAHDHNETNASTITGSGTLLLPSKVICVNRAGSVPPVSADRRTTAQISSLGNALTFAGFMIYDGIIFTVGVGQSGALNLTIGANNGEILRFDNCSLRIATTNVACGIKAGGSSGFNLQMVVELNNTTMSFAVAAQNLGVTGTLRWRNTPSALIGTIPTTLIVPTSAVGTIELIGVDLSALGSGKTIFAGATATYGGAFRVIDCKLDAAVTKSTVPVGPIPIDFVRSGAAGVNYTVYSQKIAGLLTEETTIVRSGGASA